MTPQERELFVEFWRLTHEKAPAATEADIINDTPILPQIEAESYERDENQLCLEI